MMRTTLTTLCLSLLVAAAGCHDSQGQRRNLAAHGGPAQEVTAIVRYLDLEGGFYGLVTDEGQKLDPVNLPEAFRKDGTRIRARLEELEGRASTHMWGKLVRILSIERLSDTPAQALTSNSPRIAMSCFMASLVSGTRKAAAGW
jgi:hypothetical protein